MQYTPETNDCLERCKSRSCYDCTDSGFSDAPQSPWSSTDYHRALSPVEFNETPKENLKLSVMRKERSKEPARYLGKDSREALQPSAVTWSETPKVYKKDVSLRHRLLMCKPNTDVKREAPRAPASRTDSSVGVQSELTASFESLDIMKGALASNTLKAEQDLLLSGRKRRLLFTQMKTSTVDDSKLNSGHFFSSERRASLTDADFGETISTPDQLETETPGSSQFPPVSSKEISQSPTSSETNNLYDSSSAVCTPSSTCTPKNIRSVCEDSGFGSLDKSQDSLVDHDGSFQELLRPASKGHNETPNLAEAKRHSRLQRQNRLSTLKEGGSQSEEDPMDKKHQQPSQRISCCKDNEVFAGSALSVTGGNSISSNVSASAKHEYTTPLRVTTTNAENTTPYSTDPATPDVAPHRTTPVNLSLTPALQLIHAMCQQKAQMFAGQSPSLKEQLKYTAALAETPVMFRATMPLAGLIGRKMGLAKVDIPTELKKRNLWHILAIILCQLDSESVYRCAQVSRSWNQIIHQDKQANLRRKSHMNEVEAGLELSGAVYAPDAETRSALPKRSALKMVQAQSRTSSYCTPQSGTRTLTPLQHSTLHSVSSSSSKRDKFLEVAKTLFSDEYLKPCPRCDHPARCHSVKREGVCSKADCGFQFCTSCLCAFHGSRECGSQSAGRRKKDTHIPGSSESKRNVRRL